MGEVATQTWNVDDLCREIGRVSAECQPELIVGVKEGIVFAEGCFVVWDQEGPLDSYSVLIGFPDNFPSRCPAVYELGRRIPRELDRHIFPETGACCLGVWEEWLAETPEPTVEAFFRGPLQDFFFSQTYFDAKGGWPFGERSHGTAGVVEAYAEMLGIEPDQAKVESYLRLIACEKLGGHVWCPCGSGRRLRTCHRADFDGWRDRIPLSLARQMLRQIQSPAKGRRARVESSDARGGSGAWSASLLSHRAG